ncbi:MAG: DUF4910 domain-containing protein [Anaerolineae bacterium]|nr:DUF4910 domain-containing protein [Anaerolineae bacterium]
MNDARTPIPPADPTGTASPGDTPGEAMMALIRRLYPICRSITGDGVRQTFRILGEHIPLTLSEVPSGADVYDWTVPREWNIRDAYIKDSSGRRVVDFRQHTLHVLNYSVPIQRTMRLDELRPHLFSLPDRPQWIPYRTSYYNDNWGFCVTHEQLSGLRDDEDYEVCIDSTLAPGSLTYAECVLPGQTDDEVLFSIHSCHPSLCNDNLSGMALAVALAQDLSRRERRFTYRFLFIPGTIGSITWLSRNEAHTAKIRHGLVLTNVGDAGPVHYKKSRRGDAAIDRAFQYHLRTSGVEHGVIDFFPFGYDERQYCSPGFNLPVGVYMRSQHGAFPEYHTSADNLDFVHAEHLEDSFRHVRAVLDILEADRRYLNLKPKGEPRLGKRGLYTALGGKTGGQSPEMALLWVLNLSDGQHSLLAIAERSGVPFSALQAAAEALSKTDLLAEVEGP